MIYTYPDENVPIRQGDIFFHLPRIDISLDKILEFVEDDDPNLLNWDQIAENVKTMEVILPIQSVSAVVISQNCDALRNDIITLCEIAEFKSIEGKAKNAEKPNSWQKIITQQARTNLKWFYLPPDDKIGFYEKMAVDFTTTLSIPRSDLEKRKFFRKGRLNNPACDHFRERLSEFFRRYSFNEWYSLSKDELEEYMKEHGKVEAYDWQL